MTMKMMRKMKWMKKMTSLSSRKYGGQKCLLFYFCRKQIKIRVDFICPIQKTLKNGFLRILKSYADFKETGERSLKVKSDIIIGLNSIQNKRENH